MVPCDTQNRADGRWFIRTRPVWLWRIGAALIFLLCFLPSPLLLAQQGNLERLQQSARMLCDSILRSYPLHDTLCADIARHPASWLLEEALLSSAAEQRKTIVSCDSAGERRLTLAITRLGIDYLPTDDDDLLERGAGIELHAILPGPASSGGRQTAILSIVQRDTVGSDQTSTLEASGYDFARGTIPQQGGPGFWKTIMEPAVVIGASVVMVILLFTVRSQ